MKQKTNIHSLTLQDLKNLAIKLGYPSYRGEQIFRELWISGCESFATMKQIQQGFREYLEEYYSFDIFQSYKMQKSSDGSVKFVFHLFSGNSVESVYMPWLTGEDDKISRTTLCISSQAGCGLDCKFCATGTLGLLANLKPSEIAGQVKICEKEIGEKITNVVFMGMGEPMLNYTNVEKSIKILSDEKITKISRKKITVSTSGVTPGIRKLSKLKPPVKLAISLHATTNGVRDKIMPINQKSNISELMDSVEQYYKTTKMALTYEYIPFKNLNDSDADAKRLAKISKRVPSRVNLIPFNDISFTEPSGVAESLKAVSTEDLQEFANKVRSNGGVVTVRATFGSDIDAACGQLALSERENG